MMILSTLCVLFILIVDVDRVVQYYRRIAGITPWDAVSNTTFLACKRRGLITTRQGAPHHRVKSARPTEGIPHRTFTTNILEATHQRPREMCSCLQEVGTQPVVKLR